MAINKIKIGDTTHDIQTTIANVTNLQSSLDAKANASHTHTVANITDLTATATELNYMDGVTSNVQTQLDGKSNTSHTHNYAGSSSAGGAATSAIRLDVGRTINGVAFDGSADIEIPANFGITTSGDGSAYTATVAGITSLTAGVSFTMIPHVYSASTAPTLNVNGLGEKVIRRRVSNSTTSTAAGYASAWLGAGKPVRVEYDGTYWIADLPKPSASDISGTLPIANGGTGATTAAAALTNLGAAPEGLISATYTVSSDAEIDAALNTELNKMSNDTVHHIKLAITVDGLSLLGGGNEVFVYKRTSSYAFARATRYGISTPILSTRERSMRGGTWDDWYDPDNYRMEYGYRDKIQSNADLNDYVSIGNYAVSTNAAAATLSNCPTTTAFILNVFSSNGSYRKTPASDSTGYYYYIQELIDISSNRWMRTCKYLAGTWNYDNWRQIATVDSAEDPTIDASKWIQVSNTVSGTTKKAEFGITSAQGVYFARIGDNGWENALVVADTYTKSMLPFVVPATQYGSTLPSSGVAGQLFFKI